MTKHAAINVAVVGTGAVGLRAARQLHETEGVAGVVVVSRKQTRAASVAGQLGKGATVGEWPAVAGAVDAVVLAVTDEAQADMARICLGEGASVVSTAGSIDAVDGIRGFGSRADSLGLTAVAGVGMSPGLTCLLAWRAARDLDVIDEIHVAKSGTGGPACARATHAALRGPAAVWRDARWQSEPAGSGRELCWFPEPVGGLDCYATSSAEASLMVSAFPTARRITARVAATRRDKAMTWLPMLRPPHPEGLLGGVRVEVRGWKNGVACTNVMGAVDRPAVAAGTLAALAAVRAVRGELTPGAGGIASLARDPGDLLADLAERGVKVASYATA
ncbi:MAG: NAD(P)-binding domain-containing protein [Acidimicrobiales bacterium]|nr:NAD(P)-binding domain-containing protein [Acidimicrobiales bacterium]